MSPLPSPPRIGPSWSGWSGPLRHSFGGSHPGGSGGSHPIHHDFGGHRDFHRGSRVFIAPGPLIVPGPFPAYPYYEYPAYGYQTPTYDNSAPAYWYYCPSYGAYYPTIVTCAEAWVPVQAS